MSSVAAMLLPLLLCIAPFQHPVHPGAEIDELISANKLLAARSLAQRLAKDDPHGFAADQLGLLHSFLGAELDALASFDALHGQPQPDLERSSLDDAQVLDAVATIVAEAKDRRIVVLNESHHMPRHRAFAAELARALRAIGFDTFAAEAFADVDGAAARGYPDASTGYYTREPVFGELVRTVFELGYRTVAYEAQFDGPPDPAQDMRARINAREIQQARNLFERVFAENDEARLFVYVGYSHATEDWIDKGGERELAWMAARLADLTGLDPLTIDQTTATPRSAREFTDPAWRRLADAGRLADGPQVLRAADGRFVVSGPYAGKVDLQVFHPPLAERDGRPDWLARGRRAARLPAELVERLRSSQARVVQAFHAKEPDSAVPADQFVALGANGLSPLLVRPGAYRVIVRDERGDELARLDEVVVR